jgi:hypothetical protein
MSRETFNSTEFRPPTEAMIRQANVIIEHHETLGFTLTLRQLFL